MEQPPKTGITSWELTEMLWLQVQGFIPQPKRKAGRSYRRQPGAGRKPLDNRRILEGIFYVLKTGIPWKALPPEYGAGSSIHRYFSQWAEAGVFHRMWQEGLIHDDLYNGLGWARNADGCMVKAPSAPGETKKNGRSTRITGRYLTERGAPAKVQPEPQAGDKE